MVLESAYFKPASVRRTSKRLGLKTEASTRFERGADVNARAARRSRAPRRCSQQIGAAQPLGPTIDRVSGAAGAADARRCAPRASSACSACACRTRTSRPDSTGCRSGPRARPSRSRADPIGLGAHRLAPHLATRRLVDRQRARRSASTSLREIDLIEEIARHDGYVGLPATFPELTRQRSRRPTRARCATGCCGRC